MFRQHRNDAVGKIYRRGARPRLLVQKTAHSHVVAHIGDRDDEPPAAAAHGFGVHRIIEVLGILAIDGDQRQIAQIFAAANVCSRDVGRKYIRLMQHVVGKSLGQIVPQNRKPRGKVRGTQIIQHIDNAALRSSVALRTARHLNDDIIALFGAVPFARAHIHGVPVARIFGIDTPRMIPAAPLAVVPDAADVHG